MAQSSVTEQGIQTDPLPTPLTCDTPLSAGGQDSRPDIAKYLQNDSSILVLRIRGAWSVPRVRRFFLGRGDYRLL